MAKYTSKYKELAFYVGGQRKQFSNGVYVTEDKAEIELLGTLRDVKQVAEAKPARHETKADDKPIPKAKAPAKK